MNTSTHVSTLCGVFAVSAGIASAAVTPFTYTQTDKATGSGTISAFSITSGVHGVINFAARPMPAATVNDPLPGTTPAGYIGAMNAMSQIGADNTYTPTTAVSIGWNGSVLATGTNGLQSFIVPINMAFLPPDQRSGMAAAGSAVANSDYGWTIDYGDTAANDAVFSAAPRMAVYFGTEVFPNFQRYTQNNPAFPVGAQAFNNTLARDGATIRDAGDGTAPAWTPPDAFGRPLSLAWAWRDQGTLTSGAILVDRMVFDGYFWIDDNAVTVIPEPGTLGLLGLGLLSLYRRRR